MNRRYDGLDEPKVWSLDEPVYTLFISDPKIRTGLFLKTFVWWFYNFSFCYKILDLFSPSFQYRKKKSYKPKQFLFNHATFVVYRHISANSRKRLRSCVPSVTFAHPFLLAFRLMAKVTADRESLPDSSAASFVFGTLLKTHFYDM